MDSLEFFSLSRLDSNAHSAHTSSCKKSKDEHHQMYIKIHHTYIYMIKCQYRQISDGALKRKNHFYIPKRISWTSMEVIVYHLNKVLIPHPALAQMSWVMASLASALLIKLRNSFRSEFMNCWWKMKNEKVQSCERSFPFWVRDGIKIWSRGASILPIYDEQTDLEFCT